MGPKPLQKRGGENPFFQILAAAGIPWLVTTTLNLCLRVTSCSPLYVCQKLSLCFFNLFLCLFYFFNWFTMVFNWFTKLLYNVVSVYVIQCKSVKTIHTQVYIYILFLLSLLCLIRTLVIVLSTPRPPPTLQYSE